MNVSGLLNKEVLDCLFDGAYIVDRTRKIVYWNKAAEKITGFSCDEVCNRQCGDSILKHVNDEGVLMCTRGCPLHETLNDEKIRDSNFFFHHKKGYRVSVSIRIVPVRSDDGNFFGALEIFKENLSSAFQLERMAELEKMAYIEHLTGLPNRRYFMSQIVSKLESLKRNNWPFGLLLIDIDHFKSVNDVYGHDVGDAVLTMVASTIGSSMRGFDFASRYGGEEFAVLVSNVENKHLKEIAERIRSLVSLSALREPENITISVSIGAAYAKSDDTVEDLIKRADEKLYQAKNNGCNQVAC